MQRNDLKRSLKGIRKKLEEKPQATTPGEPLSHNDKDEDLCACTDAYGHHKMLYATLKEAEGALEYLGESGLRIYPCPSEKGWHLTKG